MGAKHSPCWTKPVLLDLMMPVMSGQETLTEMRTRGISTPVIFMSAGIRGEEASTDGADAFLKKPFHFQTVLDTIAPFIAVPPVAGCSAAG
jgi:FixJ family two-component response regulator